MQKLLCGAKNLENFVDDILGYTDDVDSHLSTLRDLFERVRKANIKLKPTKVEIGFEEITFLGQVVGAGRIRPTDENIEKIVNTPIPRTKRGVQSLRGLVNWLRKFIPDAAQLLDPLNELVKKDRSDVVDWGPKEQEVLNQVIRCLTSKPVLVLYDKSKEHTICTDASDKFIGGVLMQLEDDGLLHPVMYVSRKLNLAESRYDIQNKEALAVVWCCAKFYRFVYGKLFTIQLDSQALRLLNGRLSNNARVIRWQLFLQSFNFRLVVVDGKDNQVADYLSRMGT
jgi:hypothetical protein